MATAQKAIQSLSNVLEKTLPESLVFSEAPAQRLLHDDDLRGEISSRLCSPSAGSGDDSLCRWLYDTFHSMDPDLQIMVLSFVPTIAGVYLSARRPLPGYEAVLLAVYAQLVTSRGNSPVEVVIADGGCRSIYNEGGAAAAEFPVGVLSPPVEPCSAVRATKKARIVGVSLELYFSQVALMPVRSKLEFCKFCLTWAVGRIALPWELLQPSLRILGHCLMGFSGDVDVQNKANTAIHRLLERATQDVDARAILAVRSLIRGSELRDGDFFEEATSFGS